MWGLLAIICGMRVAVALGSRLRGKDEGEARKRRGVVRAAGAGDRGWGLLAIICGMRVAVALGSRLRGKDEGEARKRRVMQKSSFAGKTRGRRGDDECGGCWRSLGVCEWRLRWVPAFAGKTRRRRGKDEGEARERRVMQRSPFPGTARGGSIYNCPPCSGIVMRLPCLLGGKSLISYVCY